MSIEVRIPKEITEYKEKIIFGLSIRQLVSFIVALILGLGAYFVGIRYLNADIASYLTIIIVMPVFAIGFIRKNGFTFEKYLKMMISQKFGENKRTYQSELTLIDEKVITKKDINKDKRNQKRIFKFLINNKLRGEENVSTIPKKQHKKQYKESYSIFKITKESSKRKCKETKSKIKTAEQEYRKLQQRIK